MPDDRYDLTIGQAAAFLGFSIDTVRKWADSGDLKAMRTPAPGKRWRFRQVDLERFIADRLNQPAAEATA